MNINYTIINDIPIQLIYSAKIKNKFLFQINNYWLTIKHNIKNKHILKIILKKSEIIEQINKVYLKNPYIAKQEAIYYLGNKFNIEKKIISNKRPKYYFINDKKIFFLLNNDEAFENWIKYFSKIFAKKIFQKIFLQVYKKNKFSQIIDLKKIKLSFRFMNSRWGSCLNNEKLQTVKITLNIILIHYPTEIIESVICHELSHILYKNHNNEFWKFLFKINPKYKILKKKLNNYYFR